MAREVLAHTCRLPSHLPRRSARFHEILRYPPDAVVGRRVGHGARSEATGQGVWIRIVRYHDDCERARACVVRGGKGAMSACRLRLWEYLRFVTSVKKDRSISNAETICPHNNNKKGHENSQLHQPRPSRTHQKYTSSASTA